MIPPQLLFDEPFDIREWQIYVVAILAVALLLRALFLSTAPPRNPRR